MFNEVRARSGYPTAAAQSQGVTHAAAVQAPRAGPLSAKEKTDAIQTMSLWATADPEKVEQRGAVFQEVLAGIMAGSRDIAVTLKPGDFPELGGIVVTQPMGMSAGQLKTIQMNDVLNNMRRDVAAYEALHRADSDALDRRISTAKNEQKGQRELSVDLTGLSDTARYIAARRKECDDFAQEIEKVIYDALVDSALEEANLK